VELGTQIAQSNEDLGFASAVTPTTASDIVFTSDHFSSRLGQPLINSRIFLNGSVAPHLPPRIRQKTGDFERGAFFHSSANPP